MQKEICLGPKTPRARADDGDDGDVVAVHPAHLARIRSTVILLV